MKDPFQEAIRARLETVSSSDGHLTVPVKPEEIAEQFGLAVVRTPLENNVGGFILKKHGEAVRIYVNSNDSQERQRFTLAHEIGHYWLHRDDGGEFGYVEYRGELSTRGTDPVERWANSFAAELIMPARYIRMAWAGGGQSRWHPGKAWGVGCCFWASTGELGVDWPMIDADVKGQPTPEDVAAAQREAEELESRQGRDSDDGNERRPDGGDRVPEVDDESTTAIRLRIEKLKADREEQSNKFRERVATISAAFTPHSYGRRYGTASHNPQGPYRDIGAATLKSIAHP